MNSYNTIQSAPSAARRTPRDPSIHSPATVRLTRLELPTYSAHPRSVLPPLFDPESTYPYGGFLTNEPQPKAHAYQAVVIENGLLCVTVLPELGGRILQIQDVRTGTAYLHENDVVRPVRIPPRWAFLSLGIELNFPTTHAPSGNDPVGYELLRRPDGGAGIAVGERDLRWGLCWRAEILLFPGFRGVSVSVRGWNPTTTTRQVQWWSNAAQPAGGDTEFVFPDEPVLQHILGEENGDWPIVAGCDRRWHRNYDSMCGLFWEPTRTDYFGIYHHDRNWGLLHLSDPAQLPGKKLWTFGQTGATADWTLGMTRGGSISCEIQSGIPTLQNRFVELKPGDHLSFVEFWMPVDRREELNAPQRPTFAAVAAQLGGVAALAAPQVELTSPVGAFWRELMAAYERRDAGWLQTNKKNLPQIWPPTGLALEPALRWAAETGGGEWQYPLALWFCAHEQWTDAHRQLAVVVRACPSLAQAQALLGLLLWKKLGQPNEALVQLQAALEELPDGQIFVHLSALLRELGRTAERRQLLADWPANDFRRRETEAELALDEGRPAEAIRILTHQPWERHHCRFRRTELWRAARLDLGLADSPIPSELGEDPVRVDEPAT